MDLTEREQEICHVVISYAQANADDLKDVFWEKGAYDPPSEDELNDLHKKILGSPLF